jgi:hypothetical protein
MTVPGDANLHKTRKNENYRTIEEHQRVELHELRPYKHLKVEQFAFLVEKFGVQKNGQIFGHFCF